MKLRLSSIEMFPGEKNIVFLAPVVTIKLRECHKRFHDDLKAAGLASDPFYFPKSWVPHCTITMDGQLSRSIEIIEMLREENVFGEYLVSSIQVVELHPVINLGTFKLANGDA